MMQLLSHQLDRYTMVSVGSGIGDWSLTSRNGNFSTQALNNCFCFSILLLYWFPILTSESEKTDSKIFSHMSSYNTSKAQKFQVENTV